MRSVAKFANKSILTIQEQTHLPDNQRPVCDQSYVKRHLQTVHSDSDAIWSHALTIVNIMINGSSVLQHCNCTSQPPTPARANTDHLAITSSNSDTKVGNELSIAV